MVEIWRWPKASLSVSLIACIETPSRPAVSRSTLTSMRSPPSCASEATSSRRGSWRNCRASLSAHSVTSRGVGAGERVLILRAARPRADLDVLHRLEVHDHAGNRRHRALQAVDDVVDGRAALVARLERDGEPAGVWRRIHPADAEDRDQAGDVGILLDRVFDLLLQPLHLGERHFGAGLGNGVDQPGVLRRQEALGHDDVEPDRGDQRQRA